MPIQLGVTVSDADIAQYIQETFAPVPLTTPTATPTVNPTAAAWAAADRDCAGDYAHRSRNTGRCRYTGGGDARHPRHTRYAGYTRRDPGYAWDARLPHRFTDSASFGDAESRASLGDLDGELWDVREESPDLHRDEQG